MQNVASQKGASLSLTLHSLFRSVSVPMSTDFFENVLADYPRRNFQIRLWDGSTWGANQQPRFTLVLKHPGALRDMFLSPSELTLAESYIFDDLDIEGDIEAAFHLADYLLAQGPRGLPRSPHLDRVLRQLPAKQQTRVDRQPATWLGSIHSKARNRRAISFHYDLAPEFFALWLDQRMIYSCAYFATEEESDLDRAQCRKLDYICRKLRLRPGDRLLDIGCGWGGLLIHAADHYGARALGITLSVRQAAVARQRIRDSGLNERCRVEVCDYRDLELDQQFDKIASVGMFEHVGEAQLPEYFSRAWRLLRPGGAFLNTGIAAPITDHREKGHPSSIATCSQMANWFRSMPASVRRKEAASK
jgi:cyclopropane-fatty-acyl-phospholipid synthase